MAQVLMTISVPEELSNRFRTGLYQLHQVKKGDISNAVCEAMELWLKDVTV